MTESTLLTDYLGRGLASARPSSVTVASGALALWFSTDTSELDFYNGAGWTSIGALPTIASHNVLANTTGGSALPSGVTLTALIDAAIGSTQGDVLYRNGTAWVVLAPGTAGNFLQTQGAGANPVWAAGGGGGSVTSVATGTGLTGGPVTSTGTIALAAIADKDLLANTSGGSAAPVPTTLTALIDAALGTAQGDILYRSATAWTVLAPGTSGQVLTTGGASANPAWAPGGGGSSGAAVYDTTAGVPALGGFTLINNGTGGFTITQGSTSKIININSGTTGAGDSKLHGVLIAAPGSTPYRVAILVQNTTNDGSGPYADFGWNDGTKYQVMGVPGQLSGGADIFNYTNANTLSATQSGPFVRTSNWGGTYWVGLRNDGTNLIYEWSNDGVNFVAVHSNAISGNFISAATNIFVGIGAAGATTPAAMAIFVYDAAGLTRAFP